MAYRYSHRYQKKIKELVKLINTLGLSVSDIISQYDQMYFHNSDISKYDFFESIIEKSQVNEQQIEYVSSKLSGLKSYKDKRTEGEYGLDLILGWLSEDCVLSYLSRHGIKCNLSGGDSNRDFSNSNNILSDSDLIIIRDNEAIPLEVICDWTGYWARNNSLDLRHNKYRRLLDTKSLLLGISIADQTGLFLDFNQDTFSCVNKEKHIPFGGKPATRILNVRGMLFPVQIVLNNLVKTLR